MIQTFLLQSAFTIFLLFIRQPAAPKGTLDTALLLSLGGVSCLVFNQWHSSFNLNAQQMDKVVDSRCFIIKGSVLNAQKVQTFHIY